MSTVNCSAFIDRLERWMEGEHTAEAQAHLQACPQCRALLDDLNSIQTVAHAVDGPESGPPDRVWASLKTQLEHEGLIHGEHRGLAKALGDWFDGVFSSAPRPALAGAYLLALIGISLGLAIPTYHRRDWTDNTRPLSAHLDTAEHDTLAMMDSDPTVSASLTKNLAIVDNYIALCEKSVQEDPDSEIARDYLYDAYQQKADLLAQMTERGAGR